MDSVMKELMGAMPCSRIFGIELPPTICKIRRSGFAQTLQTNFYCPHAGPIGSYTGSEFSILTVGLLELAVVAPFRTFPAGS